MPYDNREKQAADYESQGPDMFQEADREGKAFAVYLQEKSPYPEHENEPNSAIFALNQRLGVIPRDDKENGVVSSPMCYVSENPTRLNAWMAAMREVYYTGFKGIKDLTQQEKLAYSIDDYPAGSGMRPYMNLPVADPDRIRNWPPLAALVRRVNRDSGKDIRPVAYIPNEDSEKSVYWNGHSDIPLDTLGLADDAIPSKWLAGGWRLTKDLLDSTQTSEAVALVMDKNVIRDAQIIINVLTNQISANVTQTKDVGLDATLGVQTLIAISKSLPRQKSYRVTTLLGRETKINEYLAVAFGLRNPQGQSGGDAGNDMEGDTVAVPRMVYDIDTDQVPERGGSGNTGIDANEFIGIDNANTADLHIVAGSESFVSEDIVRSRSVELTHTMRFATQLLPGSENARVRLN